MYDLKKQLVLIGKRIKSYRDILGFKQWEVAEKAGLNQSYVGQIERGLRDPSMKALCKIAYALNIDLSDLIKDDLTKEDLVQKEIARLVKGWPIKQQEAILDILRGLDQLRFSLLSDWTPEQQEIVLKILQGMKMLHPPQDS